jgi:hypothetical protein
MLKKTLEAHRKNTHDHFEGIYGEFVEVVFLMALLISLKVMRKPLKKTFIMTLILMSAKKFLSSMLRHMSR